MVEYVCMNRSMLLSLVVCNAFPYANCCAAGLFTNKQTVLLESFFSIGSLNNHGKTVKMIIKWLFQPVSLGVKTDYGQGLK